jgi:hypothetical protein
MWGVAPTMTCRTKFIANGRTGVGGRCAGSPISFGGRLLAAANVVAYPRRLLADLAGTLLPKRTTVGLGGSVQLTAATARGGGPGWAARTASAGHARAGHRTTAGCIGIARSMVADAACVAANPGPLRGIVSLNATPGDG